MSASSPDGANLQVSTRALLTIHNGGMAPPNPPLHPEILRFYKGGQEAARLEDRFSRWEKTRTLALLDRFLPPAPGVVLDVGGGAGAYAFPLADKNYIVDLIDPVPLHIEQARSLAASNQRAPRSFQVGDARAIPCDAGTADAVLFFGPLYHLTDFSERLKAIREARRALRLGGVLLAVAVSRFASALDGIARGLIRDPEFVRIMQEDYKTGQHRNETENPDYFTTAYFHRPEEFKSEIIEGGFRDVTLCAIEGPLWAVPELTTIEQHDALMATMTSLETEATLIGASAHIMGVATKLD